MRAVQARHSSTCSLFAICSTNIIVNDADAEFDALTSLKSRMQFGRPDFDQVFGNLRKAIETGAYLPGRESSLKTTVGVYYCGPPELGKRVKDKAQRASSASVVFRFYKEHF